MRVKSIILNLIALLLLVTVDAHALTPNYDSTFTPATPVTLSSGTETLVSFTPTTGSFTNAILNLNVIALQNATIGSSAIPAPASAVFFTPTTYLFTSDLTLGNNSFDLGKYLTNLDLAGSTDLKLGLYLERGAITLGSARLTGTVAPEPATLALVAAGLIGLPFARRFRNSLR